MTLLTDAQLHSELQRCESCETKPCRDACPSHCSPADFIMAARGGEPSDYLRAAALILSHNPLGGSCGATCPDTHCMAACSREGFDRPIEIPSVQETLVRKAASLGMTPVLEDPEEINGYRVAVIGAGPAGVAAAFTLAKLGYGVEIFERDEQPGGSCLRIPPHRLPREVLDGDLDFTLNTDRIDLHLGSTVEDPAVLEAFHASIVAVGLTEPLTLGIPGEEAALSGWDYLTAPERHACDGAVAVVGGGAVAVDCAVTARKQGARTVTMFCLEAYGEMPLTGAERHELLEHGVQIHGRTRLTAVPAEGGAVLGIETRRVAYPDGDQALGDEPAGPFDPRRVVDVPGSDQAWAFDQAIVAIGHRSSIPRGQGEFFAGDCHNGPSTVVEAVASGKNAAARVHVALQGGAFEEPPRPTKSTVSIPGYDMEPVSLACDFFGRPLRSPFLLSAAPPTDGYRQMKAAFDAGWAGGIMKTAFDDVEIHIPSEYMFRFDDGTYANCDNVSDHPLSRVCDEVRQLVAEYPDRLVIASTGGPVTGDDDADAAGWQSNTRKLEAAGVMGIEYSLSCPQGGDGTEGDIVSQSAALTAKIIDWILAEGDPAVPKLFKLTAAVTSPRPIVSAIREVLDRYPAAKAGVTLANTFPTLGFRPRAGTPWDEGVVVGMSGVGVTPISNLTLATVSDLGVDVSGNGGPMDYRATADFLALGARTVQFCTIAMKYGYGIIDELHSGVSHLMQQRGIASMDELIGIALPDPITDFMDLPATKKVSSCDTVLCVGCGNCSRCSYFAIEMGGDGHPVIHPESCVGCSICTQKCISGALHMRERTEQEVS